MSIFEKATRSKLRFTTTAGVLTVEDLWDLPLTSNNKVNLNSIAISLHRTLKDDTTVSFVDDSQTYDETTKLRFDIVKHIIDVKLAERDRQKELRAIKEQDQAILDAIQQRERADLLSLPVDELRKKLSTAQKTETA